MKKYYDMEMEHIKSGGNEQANNKLPEKTIQGKLREYISEKFPFGENSYLIKRRAAEYVSGYASMLYEKELSSKDKLIELTNNNLLAALEEVNRLKELLKQNNPQP